MMLGWWVARFLAAAGSPGVVVVCTNDSAAVQHAAEFEFRRSPYGGNSPNWRFSRTAGGQRPEMWQEPLEMSGFLHAQRRTSMR
jgi:hypothetical protein